MSVKEEMKEELYTEIIHEIVANLEDTFITTFRQYLDEVDEREYSDIVCNALAQFVLSTVTKCSGKIPDKINASVGVMTQLLTELTPHYTRQSSTPSELGKLH